MYILEQLAFAAVFGWRLERRRMSGIRKAAVGAVLALNGVLGIFSVEAPKYEGVYLTPGGRGVELLLGTTAFCGILFAVIAGLLNLVCEISVFEAIYTMTCAYMGEHIAFCYTACTSGDRRRFKTDRGIRSDRKRSPLRGGGGTEERHQGAPLLPSRSEARKKEPENEVPQAPLPEPYKSEAQGVACAVRGTESADAPDSDPEGLRDPSGIKDHHRDGVVRHADAQGEGTGTIPSCRDGLPAGRTALQLERPRIRPVP